MNTESLIAAAGSIPALASHLGVTIQTVYNWKSRGIPEVRQAWIREQAPELVQAAQERAGATDGTDQPQSER